jgi:hypothetical protein
LALLSTSFLMLVWTSWIGEDFVGGGGTGEGLGVCVPVGDVVADLGDQDLDAGEGAARAKGVAPLSNRARHGTCSTAM